MKQIVFAVNAKQSYYKCLGFPQVKPNVQLPLIVPLDPGGTITLTVDENKGTCLGYGADIHFTSDQFAKDTSNNITGNLQAFHVWIRQLSLTFDPQTGQITGGSGGTYVMGMPDVGGSGNLWFSVRGPSALLDANSPGFNLSNGLGCGGGLRLGLHLDPTGADPMFEMHIEAAVSMEDVDGDGDFEVVCQPGVPMQLAREGTMHVTILFGVTGGGGGIGVLPNGRIIPIPPPEPALRPIAEGLAEVVRGLALRDLARNSEKHEMREEISRLGLELAAQGLEGALKALREVDHRRA